ncbi:hypothetical protein T08_13132 [Trichinella sp. T8]|nr:hypothetical protein T08_13132 [Trichinella sp. T8]
MDLRPAETVVLNFLSPINASKTERKIKLLISLLQSYDEAPTLGPVEFFSSCIIKWVLGNFMKSVYFYFYLPGPHSHLPLGCIAHVNISCSRVRKADAQFARKTAEISVSSLVWQTASSDVSQYTAALNVPKWHAWPDGRCFNIMELLIADYPYQANASACYQ